MGFDISFMHPANIRTFLLSNSASWSGMKRNALGPMH